MGDYQTRRLTPEDVPDLWNARAGILLTDWAGDTLRVTDGGDGALFAEMGPFDVSVNVEGVRELRDYLTEVLTYAADDGTVGV